MRLGSCHGSVRRRRAGAGGGVIGRSERRNWAEDMVVTVGVADGVALSLEVLLIQKKLLLV